MCAEFRTAYHVCSASFAPFVSVGDHRTTTRWRGRVCVGSGGGQGQNRRKCLNRVAPWAPRWAFRAAPSSVLPQLGGVSVATSPGSQPFQWVYLGLEGSKVAGAASTRRPRFKPTRTGAPGSSPDLSELGGWAGWRLWEDHQVLPRDALEGWMTGRAKS